MAEKEKSILTTLDHLFQAFINQPEDDGLFYRWKDKVEMHIKQPASFMLERPSFYRGFFPLLAKQLLLVPSKWNPELASIKIRLKWFLEDTESLTQPLFESIRSEIHKIQKQSSESPLMANQEKELFFQTPKLFLASHRRSHPITENDADVQISYAEKFAECKTEKDYSNLAGILWNDFYDVIHTRDTEKINEFFSQASSTFIPLMKKVPTNDLFIALLDTMPYFLFTAYRAPYRSNYVELAKLLISEIRKIIRDPEIDFTKEQCLPLDEVFHYYFYNLYTFLARGRLIAFQDLFGVLMDLLDHCPKFRTKFLYVPLVSEFYYWIPQAYRKKLQPFILESIKQRIENNPKSILKKLFFIVKGDLEESFNTNIIMFETLKEVYADGLISTEERKIVRDLVAALNITTRDYRTVLREAMREVSMDGRIGNGDLDTNRLMKKLVRLAMVNDSIGPVHKDMLQKAAKVLGVEQSQLMKLKNEIINQPEESWQTVQKGLRRLGWKGVSSKLIASLNWYKFAQLKLEDYQRYFQSMISEYKYDPKKNQFILDGEIKENFGSLTGEIRVAGFEDENAKKNDEELGVLIYAPRNMLIKWFEIASEIEYVIYDSTRSTFSLELFLTNYKGKIQMTRNMPVKDPESLKLLLKSNHGRYRLFIVDAESKSLVFWQKNESYFLDKGKIEPLLEAMETKHFTSIKVLSQIGQKQNPDEVVYYHAMVQNVLFLGNRQEEYNDMIAKCEKAIKEKFPEDFKLMYYLGYLYFETGQKEEGYYWVCECLKRQQYYKDALFLFCEHKLAENVLDPGALGCLKILDLFFHKDPRLEKLYSAVEKKHSLKLRPLLAKSKLTNVTFMLH